MSKLIRTTLTALTFSATILAASPGMAWIGGNGWMNGWNNGWQNGWTTNSWNNGWSNGRKSEADGHALRVIGIELPR